MKQSSALAFAILKVIVLVIISLVISPCIGALTGWLVGLLFGQTILGILEEIGITGFSMWQIGAFLGFISSFFVSSKSLKS